MEKLYIHRTDELFGLDDPPPLRYDIFYDKDSENPNYNCRGLEKQDLIKVLVEASQELGDISVYRTNARKEDDPHIDVSGRVMVGAMGENDDLLLIGRELVANLLSSGESVNFR